MKDRDDADDRRWEREYNARYLDLEKKAGVTGLEEGPPEPYVSPLEMLRRQRKNGKGRK